MHEEPRTLLDETGRTLVIVGHVKIAAHLMRWTCPQCGKEHSLDVLPLVVDSASSAWHECEGVAYMVFLDPSLAARIRRAQSIPPPDYRAIRRKYGIPEPDTH